MLSASTPPLEDGAVLDGLGRMAEPALAPKPAAERASALPSSHSIVRTTELLSAQTGRVRELSVATETTVRGQEMVQAPEAQTLRIRQIGSDARVRTLNILQDSVTVRSPEGGIFRHEIDVYDNTRKMRIYPHCRESLDLNQLSLAMRESFLREAEVTKGIPMQGAELMGVFRNVPVALISKIRFLDRRKVILYTLTQADENSRTRVHDLAAVRDVEKDVTHLVAHRTRYRTAFLK